MTTPRRRLRQYLETHLASTRLPQELAPNLAEVQDGAAPYAVRLAREWQNAEVALGHLKGILEAPVMPDALTEPLLRWGTRLAAERDERDLHARFIRALERYRATYAAAHALDGLSDVLTEWALAGTTELQPFAADASTSGTTRITLLRLGDAVSARFDRVEARLSEIGHGAGPFREVVLELSPTDAVWLRPLDPRELTLRLVFGDRYLEVATGDGSLFDVEISLEEARLYAKLRRAPARWDALESIVIMAPAPNRR